jgi:predicted Fe-Mo cluster-binding NifX family protein
MNIAAGSTDGVMVCGHLARSSAFLVYTVEDGRVVSRSVRERGRDDCGRHASFVEMLEGCRAVLCGGIGQGAADALEAHGIEPVVLARLLPAAEAIEQYLAGKLETTGERVCLCG